MDISRAIRLVLANGLRVIHIALWLTIPTVFWLWLLLAETPVECVPDYRWNEGNVLCLDVRDIDYLFILFVLFLMGSFAICCWVAGFSWQLIGRAMRSDETLPPVRLSAIGEGFRLFCVSLRYWLPAIAAAVIGYTILSRLSHEISNHGVATLLLIAAPVALVMCWGNLVGAARYAADGEHTLLYRRRENMRLALTNIRATLALTSLLLMLSILCAVAWIGLSDLLISWRELDFMIEATLGSLGFYVLLLCWSIACSYLIARYANQISIGDHLKDSEPHS